MNLVMCPNGHPNRPGAIVCTVCRAAIAAELPEEAPVAPAKIEEASAGKEKPAAPVEPSDGETPSRSRSGCFWVLAILVLALIGTGIALIAFFYPLRRETVLPDPTTEQPTVAMVVEATEVPVLPSVTSPPPTAPPPTEAPPTATVPPPTEEPPTVTPVPPTEEPEPTPELAETANLITNGDFASRWVTDWRRQVANANGIQLVEQRPLPEELEGEGQILHMSKTGSGVVRVDQIVTVPRRATEIQFLADLRLEGSEGAAGEPEGRAALLLVYQTADGQAVAYSVWMDAGGEDTNLWGVSPLPAFGPGMAPRYLPDNEWQTIDVRLQSEFVDRLPGISPDNVEQIMVMLVLMGSETCPPEACAATLEVANLQFLPVETE